MFFLLCELLVELEEFGNALALGHGFDGEAVGCHHGAVDPSLCLMHLRRSLSMDFCSISTLVEGMCPSMKLVLSTFKYQIFWGKTLIGIYILWFRAQLIKKLA